MRKSFVAISAALLLLGAGCGVGGAATSSSATSARQAAVQTAVDSLVAAGEAIDEEAVQALVSVPIDEGVAVYGVSGYFSETSKDIDWSASTWSDSNTTVALMSTDGVSLGTWKKDAAGEWSATSAFWFE